MEGKGTKLRDIPNGTFQSMIALSLVKTPRNDEIHNSKRLSIHMLQLLSRCPRSLAKMKLWSLSTIFFIEGRALYVNTVKSWVINHFHPL